MGKIVSLKSSNKDHVLVSLELSPKEVLRLKGNLENMHIFSENNLEEITRLVQRGIRDSTKYLLIPKSFRKHIKPSNSVKCTRIETKIKDILIFSIDKINL